MKNHLDLSVIIPCYNEEKNIKDVIKKTTRALQKIKISYELIIVNDGSKDNSLRIITNESKINKNVKFINHKINKGFGAAFWSGVDKSCGKNVTLIPGDNENNIDEIIKFFWLLREVDILIPYIINKENRPFLRRIISFFFNKLVNALFIMSLNYSNGTVIYNSDLLKKLKSNTSSFFFQTEILIRAIKSGYIYAEIPVKVNFIDNLNNNALRLSQILKVLKDLIKTFLKFIFSKKLLINLDKSSISFKKRHK